MARDWWSTFPKRWAGLATAGALCAIYVAVRPASADFASGDFRARLFGQGAYGWNNMWFAGHPLPGYGLVSPMLGAWIGVVPLGIISALVGTWCITLILAHCKEVRPDLADPTIPAVLFAFGCCLNLWAGRLTFGPSVAFGSACVLAMQRRRPVVAAGCAALCGLSSPVGAVALTVVMTSCWFTRAFPRRLVVIVLVSALAPIGFLGLLYSEGGWCPFPARSLAVALVASAVVGWTGRRVDALRWAALAYALVILAAFVVQSPLGANVNRLGWLAAGPVAVFTLRNHRRILVPAIAALSITWGWSYAGLAFQPADAAHSADFYQPLAAYVDSRPGGTERVEVVPTVTMRQADELALSVSLARGWESQLDRRFNPLFYESTLSDDTYHRWLLDNAVGLVALPRGVELREGADREADLIAARPSYLRPVWQTADWQVFEVLDATPLASNGATLISVEPETLVLHTDRVGVSTVRYRYTPMYEVSRGDACISSTADGWIELHVRAPGPVTLSIRLDALGSYAPDERCGAVPS